MIEVKPGILINPRKVFKVVKHDIAGHYELNVWTANGNYDTYDYYGNKEARDAVYDLFQKEED